MSRDRAPGVLNSTRVDVIGATNPSQPQRFGVGRRAALPLILALILALRELFGVPGGYVAGWGDHFVLSPEGLSWAHPGAFENDWFMAVAPQPHWSFDILTFAGQSLGILSLVYALYWACGLLAFGTATALIAWRFTPAAPWAVGIAVTVVAGITPWMIGGTGSPVIAQALPAVLSGNLIYLVIAGMLTQRRVLVVVLAPLVAVVHVQQGSIAIVLLASMIVVGRLRLRKIDWLLVLAAASTAAIVVFGLWLRPVASNLQDFVSICDQMIPYHCAAHLWSPYETISTIGLIGLTAVSALVVHSSSRWIWFSTVGLATLGYASGFIADALRIPLLGPISQGVNVYRLGAVLLPFAVWGALAPISVRLSGARHLLFLGVWGASWAAFLTAPSFFSPRGQRLVLLGLALLLPALWFMWRSRRGDHELPAGRSRWVPTTAAAAAVVLVIVATAIRGGFTLRAVDFAFIPDRDLRAWGANVRDVVPEGEVIVASPRFEWVKLVSQRAVIADCKNVPYGGEAWTNWKRRLDSLGGFEQCVPPGLPLYDTLTGQQLIDIADRNDSDTIIVNPVLPDTVRELESLGWSLAVGVQGAAGADVFRRTLAATGTPATPQ